jgi:ABC-type branched-subunit amino acid transport system substrate-binding protein
MSRTFNARVRRGLCRLRRRSLIVGCALVTLVAASAPAVAKPQHSADGRVVVQHGQSIQIVVAAFADGPAGAPFAQSVREAVQLAVERHPRIRGFAIQITSFSAPCEGGSPASLAANAATANAVVANPANVAVVGHSCSAEAPSWLPIYEAAGVVTINGSTNGPTVPTFGPTVFNSTSIPGAAFDAWYATVAALPSDVAWRSRFQARFGSPPSDFADLYYDATNVLLTAIGKTARIEHHSLVIDRAALAAKVRHTRGFRGVTCTVTLDPTGYRVNDPAALARCAHQDGTEG